MTITMKQFNLDTWLQDKSRKVVTRDVRPVRILCWDKLGDYPIIACIKYSDVYEDLETYDSNGYKYSPKEEDENDLFFADEDNTELTEFEKELQIIISEASRWTSDDGSMSTCCLFGNKEIKKISAQLLDLARKKIEKENRDGKQKPTDKIGPKFKVGDWIVYEGLGTYKVIEIHEGWYSVIDSNDRRWSVMFERESLCHIWTIQDANDGDVIYLPNGNNEYYIFIFKGIENAAVMSFAHLYQYNDGTSKVEGTIDCLSSVNDVFQPATKEQSDILFQKMKEAGYEWNAEKKELEKIEQVSAWSEDDEKMLISALWHVSYPASNGKSTDYQCEVTDWLKSLKDRV